MFNITIIICVIVIIIYYFIKPKSQSQSQSQSQICNGSSDCNLYSYEDKKSRCDPVCQRQQKVYKDYIDGDCVCDDPIQLKTINEHTVVNNKAVPFVADIELYTNISDSTTFLQSNMPNDTAFNNRNVLEEHEKDRYNSLIFG